MGAINCENILVYLASVVNKLMSNFDYLVGTGLQWFGEEWQLLLVITFFLSFMHRIDIIRLFMGNLGILALTVGITYILIQYMGYIAGLIFFILYYLYRWTKIGAWIRLKLEPLRRNGQRISQDDFTDVIDCRKKDFELIEKRIESFPLVGVDAPWGTGKTYIVNKLLRKKAREGWIIITIEALQVNTGSIVNALFSKLSKLIRENGMIRSDLLILAGRVQWNYMLSAILNFLGLIESPSDILQQIINDLNRINRRILINMEDIDRIKDDGELRKALDIVRKMTEQVPSLRILYQYDLKKLEALGLEREYIEKYIPHEVQLSKLTFSMVIAHLQERERRELGEIYKNILENIDWKEIFDYELSVQHYLSQHLGWYWTPEPLGLEAYPYRLIDEFYQEAKSTIVNREDLRENCNDFLRVLYIKFFYPKLYRLVENYTMEESLTEYLRYEVGNKKRTWASINKDSELKKDLPDLFNNNKNREIYQLLSFLRYNQDNPSEYITATDAVVASVTNPTLPALTEAEQVIIKAVAILHSSKSVNEKWKDLKGIIMVNCMMKLNT